MKTRIALLLVTSAVLLSVHARALPSASPAVSPAAPACPAESASPALPAWAEDGAVQASTPTFPRCGFCSQTGCRGGKLHAQCGIGPGGRIEWCQSLGTTCSQDGLPNCACSYMPLG